MIIRQSDNQSQFNSCSRLKRSVSNKSLMHISNSNSFRTIYFYILLAQLFVCNVSCLEKICGEYVSSKMNGVKSGTFNFDSSLLSGNDSLLCLFKFVANKNEKVMLKFDKIDVKSLAPDCINEYIDIYIEVTDETVGNYVETNFLSRWCGWKRPENLVSYNNIIVFAYHTDGLDRGSSFFGSFDFISSQPYDYARIGSTCVYEFNSKNIQSGTFMSPTYPGTYPNILNCTYKFVGQPNERIYFNFDDISLHYGADHCPYDSLKIYDYQRNQQEKIRQQVLSKSIKISKLEKLKLEKVQIDSYCGKKSNVTIYSTNHLFEMEFEMSDSLSNDEYSEDDSKIILRRGFKAYFKFSKDFADLSFITGTHIIGTNCDQLITSKEPTGVFYSPNYFRPTPSDAICKYIFEGLNDEYNFESVKLNFLELNLKPATTKNICNENAVSHFVAYGSDREKNKPKYCFVRLPKSEIRSVESQMTLVFNTINADQSAPANFKANYTFFTEFGIEGTRAYQNRTCLFTYNGDSVTHGSVNSPRFPNNYPLNLRCTYLFNIGLKNERILFTFKEFRLPNAYKNCTLNEDSLSIYQTDDEAENLNSKNKLKKRNKQNWNLMYRYCGVKVPAPFITEENTKQVKFYFVSDNTNFAQGFVFNYNYVQLPECLFNYQTTANLSSGQIVISNDLKSQYYCDWYITTEPDKIILLTIKNQNLEDVRLNQFVIRVYDLNENHNEIEQQTEKPPDADDSSEKQTIQPKFEYFLDKSTKYYEVTSSRIRIQLVTGKAMVLDEGRLSINWVAATKDKPCRKDEFMCAVDNYCIKTTNYCDKIEHCPDFSDEPDKCFIKTKRSLFPLNQIIFMIGSIVVLVVFLSLCVYCRIKSLKRPHVKKVQTNAPPPIFYKYSPANSMDYLEAAITSV